MLKHEPGFWFNCAKIRVAAYPDEKLAGFEFMEKDGRFLGVAVSGKALLELRDQIDSALAAMPQIASWKSTRDR